MGRLFTKRIKSMKQLLTLMLILFCLNIHSQELKLSKTDKTIITVAGFSTTVYGFAKSGLKKTDPIICVSGIIFTALPYIFENNKRIEINSSGINIKLKFDKKYKKCKFKY